MALAEVDPSIETEDFFVRPFTEIYFASGIKFEKGVRHGNLQMLILFAAVALFILLIACINFVNLSTARSALRAKEIGIRKILGSSSIGIMALLISLLTVSYQSIKAATATPVNALRYA